MAEHLAYGEDQGDLAEVASYRRDQRASTVPGCTGELGLLDLAGTAKLLRSRSFRSGWALVAQDLAPALASLAATWTFSRRETCCSLHLYGLVGRKGTCYPTEPRVKVTIFGEGKVGARWGSAKLPTLKEGQVAYLPKRGPIISLGTIAPVLAGTSAGSFDVAQACAAYGLEVPPAVDDHPLSRLRAEAQALAALYLAVVSEVEALGLPVDLANLYSVGGISTTLLASCGVPAPAGRFDLPDRLRGAGASAFHGGWHEGRVVGAPVPAVSADLSAAHPHAAMALGATRYLVARRVTPKDVTRQVRGLLASPDLSESATGPDLWHRLGVTLVSLEPHKDVVPFQIDGHLQIAPLELGGGTLWVHWQDAVASTLLTGRPPRVIEAVHFRPVGMVRGLRPVQLPSGAVLDLSTGGDYFGALVAERHRLAESVGLGEVTRKRRVALSKNMVNMTYGCTARVDREPAGNRTTDQAIAWDGRRVHHRNGWREVPGPYTWLPLAGSIAAGTRLMVAATMAALGAEGGDWLHVAADSLLIAATHGAEPVDLEVPGGTVRQLPVSLVEKVLDGTDRLYRGEKAWKREDGFDRPSTAVVSGTNKWGFAWDNGEADGTETALGGVFADPTGRGRQDGKWLWARELHSAWLTQVVGYCAPPDELELPAWADLPALQHFQASLARDLSRLESIFGLSLRPFVAYTAASYGAGEGTALALGAVEPAGYDEAEWYDLLTGRPVMFANDLDREDFLACLQEGLGTPLYRSVREYFMGWLRDCNRPGVRGPSYVEADLTQAVPTGKVNDWLVFGSKSPFAGDRDQQLTTYQARCRPDPLAPHRAEMAKLGAPALAKLAGLSERTAEYILAGRQPRATNALRVLEALGGPRELPKTWASMLSGDLLAEVQRFGQMIGGVSHLADVAGISRDAARRVINEGRFGENVAERIVRKFTDREQWPEAAKKANAVQCPRCGTIYKDFVPDPCPGCAHYEPPVTAVLVQCPGCGTGFGNVLPDPCPKCQFSKKGKAS